MIELYAKIKRSSKYAYQGEYSDSSEYFRVREIRNDEYAFTLNNGNWYRREDLNFYVRTPKGGLIKLK